MTPNDRAAVLAEALPYLQKFRGETFVIKYGGSAMENEELVGRVLRDVVFLEAAGINPVLVHGGGKAITRAMKAAGVDARFVDGLRVTDEAQIELIDRTLAAEIAPGIVRQIEAFGGHAEAISGKEVLKAVKMRYRTSKGEDVDLGFVGDVNDVVLPPIQALLDREVIPVISPLARGTGGEVYNINADIAAGEVAKALKARKLIYLTDVNGVLLDPAIPSSTIPTLTPATIADLKDKGVIAGGMIPKVDSAVEALQSGVGQIHFLDGRIPHALLLEIFTTAGIGTEIRND
ncbi:N-acetylglutamate kinase [Verrucomicrobium sp. GAS474]|uniref:acetylglutamate kinase n=1 Tax=Verrucomicrobium sp. GAS474 TaxID=1882831 RepID=UPI00087984CA|nr:acetylglutamate kinase [Verrucomicrobium sp. GAS474]SDU03510.1 N-acetylglutamate kinase [Verrucomicrobium sp. GAS474]